MNIQLLRDKLISAEKLSCILYFEEIASTNKYSKELPDIDDALILTNHQTSGTGRFGRQWKSNAGLDLTFSLVKKFELSVDNIHLVNFYSSYVMFVTLTEIFKASENNFTLKWPNDILLNSKKICGILLDVQELNQPEKKFIIGMGVNVNTKSFANGISTKAISLSSISENQISREEILIMFINKFYTCKDLIDDPGKLMILWKECTNFIGRNVKFKVLEDGEEVSAEVLDIENNGGLRVKLRNKEKTFYSGEITFIY